MTFEEIFRTAMTAGSRSGGAVPYQVQFANDVELPSLLNVPTGTGKTATAILGWLHRRRTDRTHTHRPGLCAFANAGRSAAERCHVSHHDQRQRDPQERSAASRRIAPSQSLRDCLSHTVVGKYPLIIRSATFYIDLLFYHLTLRCFVVIDLKMKKFTPEDAGKKNFYLSAVDSQMRHPDDTPSIGLVLCKTRSCITAEYALRDIATPIGVAEWQTKLVQSLPKSLPGSLPSIAEIESELELHRLSPLDEPAMSATSNSSDQ